MEERESFRRITLLAALRNIPKTPTEWLHWAWNHRDSHDRIRAAIVAKGGPRLIDYQIEPINQNAMKQFLQNNSQLHIDANSVLGLQSADLLDANLSDQRQLAAWIDSQYQEHFNMETALGI